MSALCEGFHLGGAFSNCKYPSSHNHGSGKYPIWRQATHLPGPHFPLNHDYGRGECVSRLCFFLCLFFLCKKTVGGFLKQQNLLKGFSSCNTKMRFVNVPQILEISKSSRWTFNRNFHFNNGGYYLLKCSRFFFYNGEILVMMGYDPHVSIFNPTNTQPTT